MMESVLVGTDIMPAATHLTASMLSSIHPSVPFKNTSIATLPFGEQGKDTGRPAALGALDLIEEQAASPLFGTGQQRVRGSAKGLEESMDLPHDSFDLAIMNPPFTRSTSHEAAKKNVPNPAFASFGNSAKVQKEMAARLKKMRRPGMAGHGNAGLATFFIDIAHAKVKPGGVIALVLPATFLSGTSWENARQLVTKHYRNITIVSIAAAKASDRAFSADTGMAEILLVATRAGKNVKAHNPPTYVNLNRRPRNMLEALITARAINSIPVKQKAGMVKIGDNNSIGHWVRSQENGGNASVSNPEVAVAGLSLYQGRLRLPTMGEEVRLSVAELKTLGTRGPLSRDISGRDKVSNYPRGPFDTEEIVPGKTPTYPALWAHKAKRETRMIVEPDKQCIVRPECGKRAAKLWREAASRLHFNQGFRINSQPLGACLTQKAALGGTAWPSFLCGDSNWEKPLVLWSNTTLGLISLWWLGSRQQPGRAIISISKLPSLAVLDAARLSKTQINQAKKIFDEFKDQELRPANEAYRDDVRKALDKAVLIDLLKLPKTIIEPLNLLRQQWCEEPSVHGGKKTRPSQAAS